MLLRTLYSILLLKIVRVHEIASKSTKFQPKNATEYEMRVLKGYPCSTEDYPFMVLIAGKFEDGVWRRICGGTLLTPEWVLTAAHCFKPEKYGTYGILAAINQKENEHTLVLAKSYIMHPAFNRLDFLNDIALMRLNESVMENVGYVKIPREEIMWSPHQEPPCKDALIMGWGEIADDIFPDIEELQCASLPMLSTSKCQGLMEHEHDLLIGPNMYCTLSANGVDGCKGDSGGPLICEGVQIGIISWGLGCGIPTNPAIYTRTDKYLKFIEDNLKVEMMLRGGLRNAASFALIDSLLAVVVAFMIVLFEVKSARE